MRRQAEQEAKSLRQLEMLSIQSTRLDDFHAAVRTHDRHLCEYHSVRFLGRESGRTGASQITLPENDNKQATQSTLTGSEGSGVSTTFNKGSTLISRRRRGHDRHLHRFRVIFPKWITPKIWELAASLAEGQWTISLKVWNTRPPASPILLACEEGNLRALKAMLGNGKASVFDCNEHSQNLLQV